MHQVMSLPCYYYCPHYWTAVPFIWLLIFQFPQLSLQLGDCLQMSRTVMLRHLPLISDCIFKWVKHLQWVVNIPVGKLISLSLLLSTEIASKWKFNWQGEMNVQVMQALLLLLSYLRVLLCWQTKMMSTNVHFFCFPQIASHAVVEA